MINQSASELKQTTYNSAKHERDIVVSRSIVAYQVNLDDLKAYSPG